MNYYSDKFIIDKDKENIFENDRKTDLSLVEKIGLEAILNDFVKEYEEESFGQAHDIKDYIRWNSDGVDIFDGVTDTYIFDHYAISEVWVTNNGCIMLSAQDLDEFLSEDEDEIERFEDSDIYERPNKFDLYCDFASVLFRLD